MSDTINLKDITDVVRPLHSSLRGVMEEGLEMWKRAARYNFRLKCSMSKTDPAVRTDMFYLKQSAPNPPTEIPYHANCLELGMIKFFKDDKSTGTSLFGQIDGCVGIPQDNKIYLADATEVKIVLANMLQIIELFERHDETVSISNLLCLNDLLAIERKGAFMRTTPLLQLPEVYRSEASDEEMLKTMLRTLAGDTGATLDYTF